MEKQTFATVVEARGDEPAMLITTSGLDRDFDVVVPEGGDVSKYLRNPVVGWSHFREDSLPIGSTTHLEVVPGRGIKARWKWLQGDPLADRVRNAFEQGVVRAASIGFRAHEWTDVRETGGRRYTKWELLEWSLCAIPANPAAVRSLKSLGLWGEDDGPTVLALADGAEDEAVLLIDDRPAMPSAAKLAGLVSVDEHDLRRLLRESIAREIRASVGPATERALNRLRGRVD